MDVPSMPVTARSPASRSNLVMAANARNGARRCQFHDSPQAHLSNWQRPTPETAPAAANSGVVGDHRASTASNLCHRCHHLGLWHLSLAAAGAHVAHGGRALGLLIGTDDHCDGGPGAVGPLHLCLHGAAVECPVHAQAGLPEPVAQHDRALAAGDVHHKHLDR